MESHVPLRAGQIKAARALLDWSQDDLAKAAKLSVATVRKLELGFISPRGKTIGLIRHALEDAGLEFIEPNGVRERPEEVTILQGRDGIVAFFDNVYLHAKKYGGEVVCVCPSEEPFVAPYQGDANIHKERMIKLNFRAKCILTESEDIYCPEYSDYRLLSKHYVDSVPFYIYGDNCAFFLFDSHPSPKIIIIKSEAISRSFRRQFNSMWAKGTIPPVSSRPKPLGKSKKRR